MAYLNDEVVSQQIDVIVDALLGKTSESFSLEQLDGSVAASNHDYNHFSIPSHQVLHFVARNDPLIRIDQEFKKDSDNTMPRVAVLLGMGGCGKSQLALEYCRLRQNDNWFSAILWFDASSPKTMARSFANFAHKFSRPNFNVTDDQGNVKYVLDKMTAWKTRWLLVFDNFDDPSAFGQVSMRQYFPRSSYGSILFTSRHAAAKTLGFHVEVTTMSDQEALELLLRRSQANRTEENLRECAYIVKRLGYHALAIDQAGAYIQARDLSLDLYMTHFSERKEKVLNEVPDLWDYRRRIQLDAEVEIKLTVFTTWELSIDLISGDASTKKDKIHMLTLAAFLDSRGVSDSLFEDYGSENIDWLPSCIIDGLWDKYTAQDILIELQSLSLIQTVQISRNETTFSLHPLIQDWVESRIGLDDRRSCSLEAILLLSTFIHVHEIYNLSFNKKQELSTHVKAVLRNGTKYGIIDDHVEDAVVLRAIHEFGFLFAILGEYDLSKKLLEPLLKQRTTILGKEHPETLKTMSELAYVFTEQGKHSEAESISWQTLHLRKKILGPEHSDTLRSMNNVATLLNYQERYDEAEPMFRQTLQLSKKILGLEHPNTLSIMNNLAFLLRNQGRYIEAELIYRQTLQLREKILDLEHPNTLSTMNNLASLLDNQERYHEAELLYRQTLQLREKTLGPEHPDTLTCIWNLAVCLKEQEKNIEAKALFELELSRCELIYGSDSVETLASRCHLARWS